MPAAQRVGDQDLSQHRTALAGSVALRLTLQSQESVRSAEPRAGSSIPLHSIPVPGLSRCGLPIISVDSKKKELVGLFKNAGRVWSRKAPPVNDHDFRSQASGIAIPRGLWDMLANRGSVVIGTSHDTPQFAVDAIVDWCRREGRRRYRQAQELLILADSGGSNGARCRLWKYALQEKLVDSYQMSVTVCHYPTGASLAWSTFVSPRSHTLGSNTRNTLRSTGRNDSGAPVWPGAKPSAHNHDKLARPCNGGRSERAPL